MTDDISEKVRALFLSALMVVSVFGGTMALSGAAAAQTGNASELVQATHYDDAEDGVIIELAFDGDPQLTGNESVEVTFEDGNTTTFGSGAISQGAGPSNARVVVDTGSQLRPNVDTLTLVNFSVSASEEDVQFAPTTVENGSDTSGFVGANIAFEADSTNQPVDISKDGDISSGVRTGPGSQVTVVNTDDFSTGTLTFTDRASGAESNVTLDNLGLNATADDVTNEENLTVSINADEFDRDVSVTLLDSDDEEVTNTTTTLDFNGEGSVNFGTQDAGNYTVVVTDVNTQVDAEDSVTVSEAAEGAADFAESPVVEQRGDVAEITVDLTATDTATVDIGSDEVNFNVTVTATDEDDDGEVTIEVNTFTNDVSVAGDDSGNVTFNAGPPNQTLGATGYDLEVVQGTTSPSNASGSLVNDIVLSSLEIQERSTDVFRTHVATTETVSDVESADDVIAALDEGTVTPRDEVASGDVLIHQVGASGLEGAIEAQNGSNVTEQFFSLTSSGAVQLEITQDDAGFNQDPKVVTLTSTNTDVIAGEDNYFLVTETSTLSNVTADEDGTYTANLTLDPDGNNFLPTQNVSTQFEVVESSITVTSANATTSENGTIAGETTAAPGAEIQVTLRSEDGVEPGFRRAGSATVQEDGTFEVTFDFSNNTAGDGYTIDARTTSGAAASTSTSGTLQEAEDDETPTPTEETPTEETPTEETPTPTEETPTPTEETPTPTEGTTDDTTDETTETTTPGFTAVLGIVALIGAALLALRRRD